jgi:thiosulfate/3-mercaptopyruvate sulfurtransferase
MASDRVLVTTDWLADHLDDDHLRIIDIRGHVTSASEPPPHYFNHRADYDKNHIPGAFFVDWVHEITDPADSRHAQIAKPERYAAVMSRLGIDPDTYVVAYDDAASMFAARLWWSLNYYGHHKVAVLDGGWNRWVAEGRPTTADLPSVAPSNFSAMANPAWYRNGQQVLDALNSPAKVIDMRGVAEFNGQSSRAARKGHIPGAINQPRHDLVQADGTLLPADHLREKFSTLGITADTEQAIFYCNAGVSASFGLLALRAAGLEIKAAMYDGSWKDWGNDPDKPIEGEKP